MGQMDAAVPCLIVGSNSYSPIPIIAVAVESVIFLIIGVLRFRHEEF
jgi:hypothetical protein